LFGITSFFEIGEKWWASLFFIEANWLASLEVIMVHVMALVVSIAKVTQSWHLKQSFSEVSQLSQQGYCSM
jgi:hypothetical protein